MEYLGEIFRIQVADKTLVIIYWASPCWISGKRYDFDNDNAKKEAALRDNFEEFYPHVIKPSDEADTYVLNICRADNFGMSDWNSDFGEKVLKRQLRAFAPYILKFILENCE